MNAKLKQILLEVVTKGLPPEDAALLLLEPSRWDKDLFGPTGDLKSIYQSYLRGEIGIGRVFDAASDIASAADSMAEIADSVSRQYGDDTRPDDVPEEVDEEDRIPAEDERVEVLQVVGRQVSSTIIDSIRSRFPVSLLEQVFPAPSGAPTDVPALMQSFESGFVVDRAFRTVEGIIGSILPQIRDAWSGRDWAMVAALYEQLQEEASGLAGDIMVMDQVADAVVGAGMGDNIIPSQSPHPLARREQLEAWMPVALGKVFEEYVASLHAMLAEANLGEMSYAGLKRITDRASREDSPIMSFVDTDAERDIAVISGLHTREAPPAPAEITPEPVPAVEPVPEPAVEPEPVAEPPRPEATLAGILGAEEPEITQQTRETFSDTLGIDDARAGRLADLLAARRVPAGGLADKLKQVLAGLAGLGFFKSWRGLRRSDPRRAQLVQGSLRQGVRSALEAGQDVDVAGLLRDAIRAVRGRTTPAASARPAMAQPARQHQSVTA